MFQTNYVPLRCSTYIEGCASPTAKGDARLFLITCPGNGALGKIRTPDPQIRSLVLYPAELRARADRIRVFSVKTQAPTWAKDLP